MQEYTKVKKISSNEPLWLLELRKLKTITKDNKKIKNNNISIYIIIILYYVCQLFI